MSRRIARKQEWRKDMPCKRHSFFAIVILLTATVAVRADDVDDYIKAEMQKQHIPGLSLAILKDGKVIKTAYSLPLDFTPGEEWRYCNVGYFALAEIIRKVTGKSWGDYLKERVFAPLEMSGTRTTTMTELVPNRADGYAWSNGKMQN